MTSKYRISIPKAVKDRLWDITFGQDAGQGKCYVCDTIINSKRFEAGHIISVKYGGPTTLNNLKCICSTCNKSMGAKNLEDFKKTYFPAISKKIKSETNTCQCCHKNIINKNINFDLLNKIQEHNLSDKIQEHDLSDKIQKQKLDLFFDKFLYIPK
jgi:hypothetical protein